MCDLARKLMDKADEARALKWFGVRIEPEEAFEVAARMARRESSGPCLCHVETGRKQDDRGDTDFDPAWNSL